MANIIFVEQSCFTKLKKMNIPSSSKCSLKWIAFKSSVRCANVPI